MPAADRLRLVYVADTMVDVRMLEGFARDFEVTLVTPSSLEQPTTFWPPRPPARVEHVVLRGGRLTFPWRVSGWLVRHRRRFDVAVALDEFVAGFGANLGRRLGGPPVVLQLGRPALEYIRCQRELTPRWRHLPRLWLARLLVAVNERLAQGIAATSHYVEAQNRRHNANVRAIAAYGVDTDFFSARWSKAEARRRLRLPIDRPIVMWRSRLAPEKDPDTFLRAIALLRAEGRDVCAVYMGGEYEAMQERADAAGVEIVARAPQGVDEIPLWYVAADVDVQTSHAEGLGVSPLESLACGTPVVVSDVGGLPETVRGGECGTVVPPRDPRATADAIARYLDDPALAATHADAGRSWVEGQYGVEVEFARWRELIASVLPRGAAGRPLRVLMIDHEDDLLGGGERDLLDLVTGLEPSEVEVHVALPAEGELADALREQGAAVYSVPMGTRLRRVSRWQLARQPWLAVVHLAAAMRTAFALARLGRRLQVDVVHSHSMKAHFLAIPAAWATRVPHVWHVKDILGGWLRRVLVRGARLDAAAIVCISDAVARQFDGTRAEDRVRVVYCGLRLRRADTDGALGARTRFGATSDEFLVGMVGHTARWKGHDVFVEAAARLAARRPDVRFAVIAGCTFPENEGAFDAAVRHRISELGIDERLTWVEEVSEMASAMAAFDVLVHASRLPEPFGRVIVEAMAQGTPVVSTTVGAGPELVAPAVGRLVEPGDDVALADVLDELLDDPDKLAAMGDAALEEAGRFDVSTAASEWTAIYREVSR